MRHIHVIVGAGQRRQEARPIQVQAIKKIVGAITARHLFVRHETRVTIHALPLGFGRCFVNAATLKVVQDIPNGLEGCIVHQIVALPQAGIEHEIVGFGL